MKQLLPLGFTRASIRKELYLSGGDTNMAACKLLDMDKGSEGDSPKEIKEESFTIASIEVHGMPVFYWRGLANYFDLCIVHNW